ncbi:MAG: methionine adenosyltransferase [Candidatus Micrarchaeota archaeon]|nr:methionine adenosyltransferase [Candidatus Micrarchaeota archaeon]
MIGINRLNAIPIDLRNFEIVERKGLGHPDTLTDGIIEEISRQLSIEYLDYFGKILHHNVDKAMITGGATHVEFGGGHFLKPIEITLSGRATSQIGSTIIPVTQIAIKATHAYLKKVARNLGEYDYVVESKISQGSRSLTSLVGPKMPRSNDTSICVGYAPLSVLERTVLNTEKELNSSSFKAKYPEVGEDIKIMGCRSRAGGRDTIELTIAAAFVSKHIKSLEDYISKKERLRDNAKKIAERIAGSEYEIIVNVNTADKGDNVYLTLTGLSCEMGDDGSAGRGNRANGLISPMRIMTMEAVAGKNPVSHIGKIYSVVANRIANDICELGAQECNVYLQSKIGHPINKPAAAIADVVWDEEKIKKNEYKIKSVFNEHLDSIPELTNEFIKGRVFEL